MRIFLLTLLRFFSLVHNNNIDLSQYTKNNPTPSPTNPPTHSPSYNPVCIDEDFESGQLNGWFTDGGTASVASDAGGSFLDVSERTGLWNGPKIVVPMDCILSDFKYQVSAKIRLVVQGGGTSNCANGDSVCGGSGTSSCCPQFTLQFKETSSSSWEYDSVIDRTSVGSDGVWITMRGTFNFYKKHPEFGTFLLNLQPAHS